MSGNKIDRAKRKAAAQGCMLGFFALNSLNWQLGRVVANDGMGAGLTEKEREFLKRLNSRLSDDAITLRKLSWRLDK